MKPQRIRLDLNRNPWSLELEGNASRLQPPEPAAHHNQRPSKKEVHLVF